LNELRDRTTELSQSLDELRTAQDRLVQTEKARLARPAYPPASRTRSRTRSTIVNNLSPLSGS
jgi:hypothetical protein